MGNRWFKKDADYPGHPKILAVGLAARGLWDSSIAHCFQQESDGWFPAVALRRIADDPTVDEVALAGQLVGVGLWHAVKDGALVGGCDHDGCVAVAAGAGDGYVVHDYLDHQPSKEQRVADRADATERQRRSRERRAGGAGAAGEPSQGDQPSVTRDRKARHADVTRDSGVRHADVTTGVSRPVTTRGEVSRGEVTGGEDASGGGAPAGAAAAKPDPPPVHVTEDQHPNAQTLLAEYIDACRTRPTDRFVKQLGREIKQMFDQRVDVTEIRQALDLLRRRGRSPNALEALINEVRNPPEPRPRASPTSRADPAWLDHAQRRYADAVAREKGHQKGQPP